MTETEEPKIESLQDFALKLLDYHGGMWSGLYSVGSCMLANDDNWLTRVDDAAAELREFATQKYEGVTHEPPDEHIHDAKVALQLADQLIAHRDHKQRLDKLDAFTWAYLECVCFTTDENGGSGEYTEKGRVLPLVETLHPETLAQVVKDCQEFQQRASALLAAAYERTGYDEERAGHDFWYTRCHHGVGYWDRTELDADDLGDKLTELAHSFGERWASIDDGILYID